MDDSFITGGLLWEGFYLSYSYLQPVFLTTWGGKVFQKVCYIPDTCLPPKREYIYIYKYKTCGACGVCYYKYIIHIPPYITPTPRKTKWFKWNSSPFLPSKFLD